MIIQIIKRKSTTAFMFRQKIGHDYRQEKEEVLEPLEHQRQDVIWQSGFLYEEGKSSKVKTPYKMLRNLIRYFVQQIGLDLLRVKPAKRDIALGFTKHQGNDKSNQGEENQSSSDRGWRPPRSLLPFDEFIDIMDAYRCRRFPIDPLEENT